MSTNLPPSSPESVGSLSTLIDSFLAEQQQLSAVERFAQWHEESPALERSYRNLIPLNSPRPGEQYAFEVDLDRCSGCKGCVTACHALNGLDEAESWRDVGLLLGEAWVETPPTAQCAGPEARPDRRLLPVQQTVTTACHHCLEPACLLGCPVLAYDKDPSTGIVRHLDDQCIGCSYCLMMCPYEVPKYSPARGIVRKCDLCHGRLAVQEAPACVQACPNEAIRVTLVQTAPLRAQLERQGPPTKTVRGGAMELADRARGERGSSGTLTPHPPSPCGLQRAGPGPLPVEGRGSQALWLADSPDPSLTLPTTRFRSEKGRGSILLAADHGRPQPAPRHWPLVLMLVLTQAGAGALVAALHLGQLTIATGAWALWCAGLVASVFHLGQPLKAWRIWLGWRTSWLSREAMVLAAYSASTAATLGLIWSGAGGFGIRLPTSTTAALTWALTAFGFVVVWTQTKVYADTGRAFWRPGLTFPRFLGTMLIAGCATGFWIMPTSVTAASLGIIALLKLALEVSIFKHADTDALRWSAMRRTAVLQQGALRGLFVVRLLLLVLGAVFVPFTVLTGSAGPGWAGTGLICCLLSELAERLLFFASVAPDKMPGLP